MDELIGFLPDIYNTYDREQIIRAYRFGEKAHGGQKRDSGEPYFSHCVSVALILAEFHLPINVIIAGLLHDVVEDTQTSLDDVRRNFGEDVTKLVDGVTKLTNIPYLERGDQHSIPEIAASSDTDEKFSATDYDPKSRKQDIRNETLRKIFFAMGKDVNVVLIKLSDRLHNMRTLGFMSANKQKRIAQETLDIYAPLANRLGIWKIKSELEDLAFRYLEPEKFKEISDLLSDKKSVREKQVQQIIEKIKLTLEQAGIQVEISGRPKHIYSIYRKMVEKGKSFEMLRDLRGVRLIVADLPTCYTALGVVHARWTPIPQEFDDYIGAKKSNNYQSLHTAVIYEDGKSLEVQIRTAEMHENAEFGIAAHWQYKEGTSKRDKDYEQRINWLRKLIEDGAQEDAQRFVDDVKEGLADHVYVFTPKGDLIELPQASTPIDFAYQVHTAIGHRCRGAKINGKLVNLDYCLKTGDQVEILTTKQGGPSRDWLNPSLGLVRTERTRSKIRQWFKRLNREQNIQQGKEMLEKELHRLGLSTVDLDELARKFDIRSEDDLYVGLGCGDVSLIRVIKQLNEMSTVRDPLFDLMDSIKQPKKEEKNGVMVMGLKGMLTNVAHCCNPTPGEDILGYITRFRGVTIHRATCPNILRIRERERIIKVTWGAFGSSYPCPVEVKAYDRQGLMGDIANLLQAEGVNLLETSVRVNHNLATFQMILEVGDIEQVSRVLARIENLPNVMEAHRVKAG